MAKSFIHGRPRSKGGRRVDASYILLENGEKILLEDGSGCLLLEHQDVRVIKDWNMRRDGKL